MKYFTEEELTRSATALHHDIDNRLPEALRSNLHYLVDNVLDPLREAYGGPIIVTSGYRCAKLNKLVGGASESYHLRALAADIHGMPAEGESARQANARLARLLLDSDIRFDQAILYETNDVGPQWIHVSIRPPKSHNRRSTITLGPAFHA